MPRPNAPRTLFAEPHVAWRIGAEREARGWTYEGLAKRMSDAGCPIHASAIYKVERASPRRRITVDELIGFAEVFGLTVGEMLVDPALQASRLAVELLERYSSLHQQYMRAMEEAGRLSGELHDVIDQVADAVRDRPEVLDALRAASPRAEPTRPALWEALLYEAQAEAAGVEVG